MTPKRQLEIGREIVQARRKIPPVPWKTLSREHGLERSRLYEIYQATLRAETVDMMTAVDVLDLRRIIKECNALVDSWIIKTQK